MLVCLSKFVGHICDGCAFGLKAELECLGFKRKLLTNLGTQLAGEGHFFAKTDFLHF